MARRWRTSRSLFHAPSIPPKRVGIAPSLYNYLSEAFSRISVWVENICSCCWRINGLMLFITNTVPARAVRFIVGGSGVSTGMFLLCGYSHIERTDGSRV
jgi:hypothetical protein